MPDMGSVSTDSMTEVMVDGDMAEMPSGDASSPANMADAAVDGVDMQAVATDAELEPFPAGEQCGIVQQPLPTLGLWDLYSDGQRSLDVGWFYDRNAVNDRDRRAALLHGGGGGREASGSSLLLYSARFIDGFGGRIDGIALR